MHTADEINAGMAKGLGFEGTFDSFEETDGEDLDELRSIFRRKAFISRQEKLCRTLLADGYLPEVLAGMRLDVFPSSEAKEKYLPAGRSSGWTSRRMRRSWWTRTAGRSLRRR